jgi:uncharacterized membrane protein
MPAFLAWVRRRLITGFFVTVPLVVSVVALVWVFRLVDSLTTGVFQRLTGREVPGPAILVSSLGIVATALLVLAIGILAANVFGRRLLQRGEALLLHVPVFRTIYAPVKQLIAAFSPDNEYGFKRVVLIDGGDRGSMLGFLTREFTLDRGRGAEAMIAVYVPTNNLYLGNIVVCPADRATFPDLTVEQGVRVFLTGGMALPERLGDSRSGEGSRGFRV